MSNARHITVALPVKRSVNAVENISSMYRSNLMGICKNSLIIRKVVQKIKVFIARMGAKKNSQLSCVALNSLKFVKRINSVSFSIMTLESFLLSFAISLKDFKTPMMSFKMENENKRPLNAKFKRHAIVRSGNTDNCN